MPHEHAEALRAAIESLYTTLGRYNLVSHVSGCPCCTSPEDDQLVRSRPLRQLMPADLERFAFKAMTTLGTLHDFKHFLPRLLELAAWEGEIGYADLEVVLGKLRYCEWNTWPQAERGSVEQYLASLWQHVLSTFPSSPEIDDCLCGIANAVDDLSPFLNAWRRDNSATAVQHVASFVEANFNTLSKKGRLRNAFWEGREPQLMAVASWLTDREKTVRMEQAFFRYSAAPFAADLSLAVERLVWLRGRTLKEHPTTAAVERGPGATGR